MHTQQSAEQQSGEQHSAEQRSGSGGWGKYRRRTAAVVAVVGLALTGAASGSAFATGAKEPSSTHVLHFYSKTIDISFTTAAGKPFDPGRTRPVPGDQIEETDLDYVGNHLHHAKRWTASDHLLCVYNAKTVPVCDGQVARGGSMVLARGAVKTSSDHQKLRIYGGTGSFQGAIGTLVSAGYSSDSDNSDMTISWRHR